MQCNTSYQTLPADLGIDLANESQKRGQVTVEDGLNESSLLGGPIWSRRPNSYHRISPQRSKHTFAGLSAWLLQEGNLRNPTVEPTAESDPP